MSDPYYALARQIQSQDRQTAAVNIRKIQQQTADQVIESVLCAIADSDGDLGKLAEEVRKIKLDGTQHATDRLHLRRTEAILLAISGYWGNDSAPKDEVERIYNMGDGIRVFTADGLLHIEPHLGKFKD
jgi:hypothetical protein